MKCPETIGANNQGKWLDKKTNFIAIPPVSSSYDGICPIIKISYEVRFSFGGGGMKHNQLDISIPIKIGTIPILNDNTSTITQEFIHDESKPLMQMPMPFA